MRMHLRMMIRTVFHSVLWIFAGLASVRLFAARRSPTRKINCIVFVDFPLVRLIAAHKARSATRLSILIIKNLIVQP